MITGTGSKTSGDWRWLAIREKNPEFDGLFYFGVRTTGIFCRPSCSSKTPRPENVAYFSSTTEAQKKGFRACMRCKPTNGYFPGSNAELVVKALETLRNNDLEITTTEERCKQLNVSPGHLQ